MRGDNMKVTKILKLNGIPNKVRLDIIKRYNMEKSVHLGGLHL